MFVVMAVKARQFSVAPVGRVVVVIVVPVMNGQLAQVRARKFAAAATADPRIDPPGLNCKRGDHRMQPSQLSGEFEQL